MMVLWEEHKSRTTTLYPQWIDRQADWLENKVLPPTAMPL